MSLNNVEAIAEFTGQTVTALRAQRRDRRFANYATEAGDIAVWQLKQLGAKRLMFKFEVQTLGWKPTPPALRGGLAFDEEDIPTSAHWLGQRLNSVQTFRMLPDPAKYTLRAVWVLDQTQLTMLLLTIAAIDKTSAIASTPRFASPQSLQSQGLRLDTTLVNKG